MVYDLLILAPLFSKGILAPFVAPFVAPFLHFFPFLETKKRKKNAEVNSFYRDNVIPSVFDFFYTDANKPPNELLSKNKRKK